MHVARQSCGRARGAARDRRQPLVHLAARRARALRGPRPRAVRRASTTTRRRSSRSSTDDELAAAATPEYVERLERVLAELAAERERRTWWQRREEDDAFCVAYFSCEFGLDESLPIYSGGLGVLAGDHLKSASDLGVPLVGVGLFYREGYFRQQLDENDWQVRALSAERPGAPAADARDRWRRLRRARRRRRRRSCRCARRSGARRSGACRSTSSTPTSTATRTGRARSPTRSTAATARTGCARSSCSASAACARCARSALEPTVFHMNEGHSAFFQLERLRELVEEQAALARRGAASASARRRSSRRTRRSPPATRSSTRRSSSRTSAPLVARCGFDWDEFVGARPRRAEATAGFGLTPFALRTSAHANGVSALHGEVSRAMWHGLWPDRPVDERADRLDHERRPRAHVDLASELDALLGTEEDMGTPDFARAYDLDDEALWRVQRAREAALLDVHALARPARLVRPGRADDRLRAPLRDVQARRPALQRPRAARPAPRRRRAPAPDRARRQGAPGRRGRARR